MSVKIVDVDEGVVTLRIVGKLQYAEFEKFQKTAAKEIARLEKVRVLVLAEDFEGWGKDGNWGDLSLQTGFDKNIERMANRRRRKVAGLGRAIHGPGTPALSHQILSTGANS